MQTFNRFTVFIKRILCNKLYFVMLFSIILLAVIYMLLPEKSRSADIRVAVCSEDDSGYTDSVMNKIEDKNSLYSFYFVSDINDMLSDVKSGYAECGYFIPDVFFDNYINGKTDDIVITQYTTPSTTLGAAINETLFSAVFSVCADKILILSADMPEYNDELTDGLYSYMDSDSIFKLEDQITGEFTFENMVYKINLPIYEICLIFILFSGLLGLLMYQRDNERGIYIALAKRDRLIIKAISYCASMLPVLIVGAAASAITGVSVSRLFLLVLFFALSFVFDMVISLVIRKSTILANVLPLIILVSVITAFIYVQFA